MSNKALLGRSFFAETSSSVLIDWTRYGADLNYLINVVDHSITNTGRMHIVDSLNNPSVSLKKIEAKHEALDELRVNTDLRQSIVDMLVRFKAHEDKAGDFYAPSGRKSIIKAYAGLWSAREIVSNLPRWGSEIPEPESAYLKKLKSDIVSLNNSPVYNLAKGPIFTKLFKKEVIGLGEINKSNWKIFPLPYVNSISKLGYIAGATLVLSELASLISPELISLGALGGIIGGELFGIRRDVKRFHNPLAKRLFREPRSAYAAVGALDELLSFNEFDKEMKYSTLPIMSDDANDFFEVKSLINPVRYKGVKADPVNGDGWEVSPIRDYVDNDIFLGNGSTLKFLTGPNRSGKKSLAKAVVQARILAQAGCYVPAKYAKMNIAHQIHYLIGHNNVQFDTVGGLEMQFVQARELLFNSNSRTFLIIDDLIDETTASEKLEHTKYQLCGFVHKGVDLLYVTYDCELAASFQKKNIGTFSQIEFNGDKSTYKIIPGISKNSRSDIIAKKTGFDKDAIQEHLVKMGYLREGQKIDDFRSMKAD